MRTTIGKQIISGDFEATSKYICTKVGAVMLDSNMGGSDYKQLAQEFKAIQRFRPNNNRLCLHAMLALPHRDESHFLGAISETLSDEQWKEIGRRWLSEMGFDDNQYFMVRHTDTNHDHLHMVVNRVKLSGEVVSDSYNYHRSEAIIRKIEQDYNLEAVTPSWETPHRAPGRAELKEFERKGTDSVRLTIAALAREAALNRPTMPEYIERMREFGVGVEVHATRNGYVRGLSYEMKGYAFQGGDIGKAYTWNGLQKYLGVTYVASRDFETICTQERSASDCSHQSARTSKRAATSGFPVEPAGSNTTAAALNTDTVKQRVEVSASNIAGSFEELIRDSIATAASIPDTDGSRIENGKLGVETAANRVVRSTRDLAASLNSSQSTPRNTGSDGAEIELQRTDSSADEPDSSARTEPQGTSTTTKWTVADIQRQFEELDRIHEKLRQKRRRAVREIEDYVGDKIDKLVSTQLEPANPIAAAQKKWESSPVWQQREDWERNMITAAFKALKNVDRELSRLVTAKFSNDRYTATLLNFNYLTIEDNHLWDYKYTTHRDSLAHKCNLLPNTTDAFASFKLQPEPETFKSSSSEPPDRLLQFFHYRLSEESSKSTEQPSSQPTKKLQLPEGDEAKRDYVDKFYQKYASRVKQQSDLKRVEDVDVGVALIALEDGYSANDARCMLLRSPKSQEFKRSSVTAFSDYTKQRVAIALCEKQLDSNPQQRERVEIVKPIIEEFCKGLEDGKQIDGTDYTLQRKGGSRIMIAHDGRGEVFKLTGRWVERCNLTDSDVRIFQKAAARLAELERQEKRLVRTHAPKPENKSDQMEL